MLNSTPLSPLPHKSPWLLSLVAGFGFAAAFHAITAQMSMLAINGLIAAACSGLICGCLLIQGVFWLPANSLALLPAVIALLLKLILGKLGFDWADSIYHLSYGMVELPEGKMKSREGTVVDADDLIEKMYNTAKETSLELGKIDNMTESEQDELFRMISLGALKYFIIKVDPKKTMLFDPKESIDFNGNTGPFIQYTHARIKSILRKASEKGISFGAESVKADMPLSPKEIRIIKILNLFPSKIAEGGEAHSPAVVANYAYELAKEFNQYYHDTPILREENAELLAYRLVLVETIAKLLSKAMSILGITLPDRM